MQLLSAKQMQQLDKWAIKELGIPQIALMENAGKAVADQIARISKPGKVTIIAYKGNNGGDGFVAARHLKNQGFDVEVFLLCGPSDIAGSAKINLDIIRKIKIPVHKVSLIKLDKTLKKSKVVVDAIFGIGLKGEIRGDTAKAIDLINKHHRTAKYAVVAVDVPSGLDATTGNLAKHTLMADYTVTFAAPKVGFFKHPAVKNIGRLIVADIGIPRKEQEKEQDQVQYLLPKRLIWTHKGSYGRLLIVAGSRNMSGAAYLTAKAALRAGAGLVYLAVPESLQKLVAIKAREVITFGLPETKAGSISQDAFEQIKAIKVDVLAIGPGLTTNPSTQKLVQQLVSKYQAKKIVIDADALNCLADQPGLLKKAKGQVVITPHPGEMGRLVNKKIEQVQKQRMKIALAFARKYQVEVVLKGAYTIIANSKAVVINSTGNPGMAKAGVGDVLTGLLAGFLAQGLGAKEAVYFHGLAGDLAAQTKSENSLIASDIVEKIPDAIAKCS